MSIQNNLLPMRATALSSISVLILSLFALSSVGSQVAGGQFGITECEDMPIKQVGANGAGGVRSQ